MWLGAHLCPVVYPLSIAIAQSLHETTNMSNSYQSILPSKYFIEL